MTLAVTLSTIAALVSGTWFWLRTGFVGRSLLISTLVGWSALSMLLPALGNAGEVTVQLAAVHTGVTTYRRGDGTDVPFETVVPGIGYRFDDGMIVGAYRNSVSRISVGFGREWTGPNRTRLRAALVAYPGSELPIMPALSLGWVSTTGVRFDVTPFAAYRYYDSGESSVRPGLVFTVSLAVAGH